MKVTGTVIFGDSGERAEDVSVTLTGPGTEQTTKTNKNGDFEFDGLEPDQEFSVKIASPGYTPKVFAVQTKEDVHLGEIVWHLWGGPLV